MRLLINAGPVQGTGNIMVNLLDEDGNIVESTLTNHAGRYRFGELDGP
ncbi:MAG: hypothetical protein R3E01_09855 [Pirellulaceae bacterium]|nr:hypothetical protein [Planctomycetales bacterium]